MKKLIIFLFLIAVLVSNLMLPSKTNINNKNQISLQLMQALADDTSEDYYPDPEIDPIPNRVFPPHGWPDYIVNSW